MPALGPGRRPRPRRCCALSPEAPTPGRLLAALLRPAARSLRAPAARGARRERRARRPPGRAPGGLAAAADRARRPGLPELLPACVGADPADPPTGTRRHARPRHRRGVVAALRLAYRRHLLVLAGRDLAGELGVDEVGATLADLADRRCRAGLAVAVAEQPAGRRRAGWPSSPWASAAAGSSTTSATSTSSSSPTGRPTCERRRHAAAGQRPDADLRRRRPGRSTRRCGPRARPARWCAPWPATRPTTSSGPAPGSSRRCSRCGRSPATRRSGRRTSTRSAPLVWTAGDRPRLRRRRAGDAPAGRGQHPAGAAPTGSSSSAAGGLRDVEFAVQLLQLVHGRADESLRVGGTLPALDGAVRRRLRRPGRRRDADRLLPVPAHASSTGCSCCGCAAPTCCPPTSRAAALAGPVAGLQAGRPRRRRSPCCARSWRCTPARCGGCTRSCSTGRCCTRWPGCPASSCSWPRRRPATGCGRSASPIPEGALRHLAALTGGVSRSASMQRTCCRCCCRRSPTCPNPDAGLLAYRQVSEALGRQPVVPAAAARRGPGGRAAGPAARLQPVHRLAAHPDAGGAARCSADDDRAASRARPTRWPAPGARRPARAADPQAGMRRAARAAPPGAAADGLPPTCSGRLDVGRVGRGAHRHRRRHPAGGAGRRAPGLRAEPGTAADVPDATSRSSAWAGSAGREMGYGSDADVLFVHRPAAGRRREQGHGRRQRRGARRCAGCSRSPRPTRRSRWTPTCGRRAGRARWSAASPPTGSTTSAGRRSGRCRRCCGPCRSPATWTSGAEFVALIDPIRYPAERADAASRWPRSAGSRPGWSASGCPAAPTRPRTPSSAAAAWPTSSGPCSCCSCSTPRRCPALRTLARCEALAAAAEAGLLDAEAGRGAARGVGAGHPRPQRDLPGPRAGPATSCPGRAGAGRRGPGLRLPAGPGPGPVPRRLPADHPARPRRRRARLLRLSPPPHHPPRAAAAARCRSIPGPAPARLPVARAGLFQFSARGRRAGCRGGVGVAGCRAVRTRPVIAVALVAAAGGCRWGSGRC